MLFTFRSFLGLLTVLGMMYWHWVDGKRFYALLWWFLASKSLLKNPQILHPARRKLKMIPKHPKYSHWLCAHRGGSAEAPENTL